MEGEELVGSVVMQQHPQEPCHLVGGVLGRDTQTPIIITSFALYVGGPGLELLAVYVEPGWDPANTGKVSLWTV